MNKQCDEFIHIMHQLKRMSANFRFASLSHGEFITLGVIVHSMDENKRNGLENRGIRMSEIAKKLSTSKPDVSKKVKLLEEKELVKRISDSNDKRVAMIVLTEKGHRELENKKQEIEYFITNVLERMGDTDSEVFLELLKKLMFFAGEEMKNIKKTGKDDKKNVENF